MKRTVQCAALFGIVYFGGNAILADDYKPGDQVVVIANAKLAVPDNAAIAEVWPGLVLKVSATNGKWLWVNNFHPGWLDQRYVIPLNRAAIDRLTAMIQADPRNHRLYSGRADVWEHLGEIDIAIGDYNEAIRVDPSAAYYGNRGLAWQAKGEYDKAIADHNEALRLDPNGAGAYIHRGLAWKAKGEYHKAIADYNEALRLDPKSPFAYINRGSVWEAKGEYDKAMADYNEVLRLDPKFAAAYSKRGFAWKQKGEYDMAIADYGEALRIDPKHAVTYNNRGVALRNKGEYDKAIADCNEALRLDPKYTFAYINLAWLRATCPEAKYRDGKQAIADATKACELSNWKDDICIGTLAAAYAEHGNFEEAMKHLNNTAELGEPKFIERRTKMLDVFKAGKPYREEKK